MYNKLNSRWFIFSHFDNISVFKSLWFNKNRLTLVTCSSDVFELNLYEDSELMNIVNMKTCKF